MTQTEKQGYKWPGECFGGITTALREVWRTREGSIMSGERYLKALKSHLLALPDYFTVLRWAFRYIPWTCKSFSKSFSSSPLIGQSRPLTGPSRPLQNVPNDFKHVLLYSWSSKNPYLYNHLAYIFWGNSKYAFKIDIFGPPRIPKNCFLVKIKHTQWYKCFKTCFIVFLVFKNPIYIPNTPMAIYFKINV